MQIFAIFNFVFANFCCFKLTNSRNKIRFRLQSLKFAHVELAEKQGKIQAAEFLKNLIEKVPYKIHTILTDNGVQFTNQARNHRALPHIFDRVCEENGIEHRLTLPAHPWTNGQVERMNKTINEATVHRYYYESRTSLQEHLQIFIDAYNFAKRLKTFMV